MSDLEVDTDRISFTIDEVGEPVLVKASYFPNWRVSGADGPYRVAPNLMVVVPTDEQVELTYGREPIEWFAYLMTLVGLVGLVWLARRPPLVVPEPPARASDEDEADAEPDDPEPDGAEPALAQPPWPSPPPEK